MNQNTRPPPEERFHANVIGLGELIYDLVRKVNAKGHNLINPELVKLAVCLLGKLDHGAVINTFIHKSNNNARGELVPFEHHCWTKIKAHDRSFFLENAGEIFSDLPMNRVDAFSRMFSLVDSDGNPVVPEEDEAEIWDYFESLVKIAIKYIHNRRGPTLIRRGTEEIRRYNSDDFFSKVDIARHAELWNMDLEFEHNGSRFAE